MQGIPVDLRTSAFYAPDGEPAWNRADAGEAIGLLADQGFAILGGEVWFVPEGQRFWTGLIPQRGSARPAAYSWRTEREPDEAWAAFVERSAAASREAVERMPGPDDLPADLAGRILYNLTWTSEAELAELEASRAGRNRGESGGDSAGEKRGFLARLFGRR